MTAFSMSTFWMWVSYLVYFPAVFFTVRSAVKGPLELKGLRWIQALVLITVCLAYTFFLVGDMSTKDFAAIVRGMAVPSTIFIATLNPVMTDWFLRRSKKGSSDLEEELKVREAQLRDCLSSAETELAKQKLLVKNRETDSR